jgi:hypothetical protein
MTYARAIERVRSLVLARTALDSAMADAINDLLAAADEIGDEGTALRPERATTARRPGQSGVLARSPWLERRIAAHELERYARQAWVGAVTEDEKCQVRAFIASASARGFFDAEIVGRLQRLMAA